LVLIDIGPFKIGQTQKFVPKTIILKVFISKNFNRKKRVSLKTEHRSEVRLFYKSVNFSVFRAALNFCEISRITK